VLPVDLTDPPAARALVPAVVDLLGRLDALVNTAGFARLVPMEQVTPELWRQTIDGNLSYVVDLTAAAWPVFREQGAGVIVNVSSLASVDPFPHFSLYAAAKVGLNLFTRCAGREGQPLGIRTVCLAPGAIETPMLRALWSEKVLPREKALDPLAVAAVIRDCVTGARRFESGETILLPSP
jgi:NAD(P)-dependent dehydrogenase (short-subunit alcohol dehydrogenase family)